MTTRSLSHHHFLGAADLTHEERLVFGLLSHDRPISLAGSKQCSSLLLRMTQCTDHSVFCVRKYQPENEMVCPLVAESSISIGRSFDMPLLHINSLVSTRKKCDFK